MQVSDDLKIIKLNWVRISGPSGKNGLKQNKNNLGLNKLKRTIIIFMTSSLDPAGFLISAFPDLRKSFFLSYL